MLIAACGGSSPLISDGSTGDGSDMEESASAPPTATPEPFIVGFGEEQRLLMAGTPQETPYYVFGSGRLGPIVVALGGVHGNEPGGWMAAERLVDEVRPANGALIVVPRANKQAIALFQRTTDELGDLNRLYPGDASGQPMARMAYEIVDMLKAWHATQVIDMHESWSFYADRTDTQTGTAWLGQTMSSPSGPGATLARALVDAQNGRMQAPREEFFFRDWPPRNEPRATATPAPNGTPTAEPGTTGSTAVFGGSRSSLGLPNYVPGLAAILVEMGQQQPLERRVQMHVDIVKEALVRLGA
jgi:hypothetical protein